MICTSDNVEDFLQTKQCNKFGSKYSIKSNKQKKNKSQIKKGKKWQKSQKQFIIR